MALTLNPDDSMNRSYDCMMREVDYRLQRNTRELQYQMQTQQYMYPSGIASTAATSVAPKNEKKDKLKSLIAHYYHLRK